MTNRIINLVAFTVLTFLWLGFAVALVFNPEVLDSVWQMFRGWPILVQIVLGILFLPVVLGLWIWETSWPVWLRLILVVGLGYVTVYTFFPRKAKSKTETSLSDTPAD